MTLRHWLAKLGGFGRTGAGCGALRGRGRRRRAAWRDAAACLELLEDRTLLTVYVVNTIADSIQSDGVLTLREAITAANTNAASGDAAAGSIDGDVIRFEINGTRRFQLDPTLGEFSVTDDLLIDGSSSPVRVALSGERGVRVFRINTGFVGPGTNQRVEFRGFNVVAGQGVGAGGLNGGAILVQIGSDLTLRDVSVSGRTPVGFTPTMGGGIHNAGRLSLFQSIVSGEATSGGGVSNTGTLSLVASWVVHSRATGGGAQPGGGGIFNDRHGEVTISGNSLIGQNRANVGGGIFTVAGRLRVTGSAIQNNIALRDGGGIAAREWDDTHGPLTAQYDVRLTDVTLRYNIAGPTSAGNPPNVGDGGGFHGLGPGTTVINGGAVSGNVAAHQGGGLWNGLGGVMTLTGGIVLGNVASRGFDDGATENAGGGIFNAGNLAATGTAIRQNTAASNGARLGLGGGVENASAGATRLTDLLVYGNVAGLGGGVHNAAPPGPSFLDVLRCRVQLNEALQSGGGIASSGRLTVAASTIVDNVARGNVEGQGGGGIFNDGGTADIRGTFIVGNAAAPANASPDPGLGSGGGILNGPDGRLTVLDSTIENNSARRDGGGVADYTGDSEVPLNSVLLAGVFLRDNRAGSAANGTGRGGGLYSDEDGVITLFRNVIRLNTAVLDGGGVWLGEGGVLRMDETAVRSNRSERDGGGLYSRGAIEIATSLFWLGTAGRDGGGIWTDGLLNLVNSTVGENDSRRSGGGIYVEANEETFESVLIANATIFQNRADFDPADAVTGGTGGGLFIGAGEDVTLHNTVVAQNTIGPVFLTVRDDVRGIVNATSSFNFIGNGTGSSLVNGVNGNQVGTAAAPIDPGLHSLQDNGGPTMTYRPLSFGSPLVDQGRDVLLTGRDQRVRPRPVDLPELNVAGGDGSDIGAVEVQLAAVS